MNHIRCDVCGKFSKYDDLISHYTSDSDYSTEDLYYSCIRCEEKCVCGQYLSQCVDCPYGPSKDGKYY